MVSRLWALLHPGEALPAAHQVLEEACAYIRRLQAEADGLAERLGDQMPPPPAAGRQDDDDDVAQLVIFRSLLT